MVEKDAPFPIGVSVQEARARILEVAARHAMSSEMAALEAARGRILAHDVRAPCDVPGFANSAMDGFALRGADLPACGEKRLRLTGEIFAGGHAAPSVETDCCVRITTGAPIPPGADTVVKKEDTRVEDETIIVAAGTTAGTNVRPAGEDYRAGDIALKRGCRLGPAQLGVLASFGSAGVEVSRRPRAVLLTTGDELVSVGDPLGFGQIHDSNRYSLGGLLEGFGVELIRHERVRDDPAALGDALRRAGEGADIVITSGGVSAGEADFLPRLVAEIGEVVFWKVRIKPGMPFLFGRVGRAILCALPGNPVSGFAITTVLVRPALDTMCGANAAPATLHARLRSAIDKRHARAEFLRARLECDEQGILWATPHARQGSGMLRGVAEADALILLSEGARQFAQGESVRAIPLPGWPA
ncbi:MAG: molybdopterin molybdotransferase MoeA [Proteobacteria bacterium]|nr:molybdopterin molybdotransferase MoeA [Pseudomonadota bacterium]